MSCPTTYCISNTSYPLYNDTYNDYGTYDGYPTWIGTTNGLYIYFNTTTTEWCLSDTQGGCCFLTGKSPCTSSCPDLYDAYLSSGTCPTPTPTPTNNCSVLDFNSYFECEPVSFITPSVTATPTLTPTNTVTPTFACGVFNVVASLLNVSATPTATPTNTPTPSRNITRDVTFSGDVTFNTVNTVIDCGIGKQFAECTNPNNIYTASKGVINPSGGGLTKNMVFKAIIDGSVRCIYFIGETFDAVAANTITLTEGPLGFYNIGGCGYCDPTPTPTMTPSKTPFPTVTPTQTSTATPTPTPTRAAGGPFNTGGCIEGNVYQLPVNTANLYTRTTLATMTPLSNVAVNQFNIPKQPFTVGFPGVPGLFEWFQIAFDGTLSVPTTGSYMFRLCSDDGAILRLYDGSSTLVYTLDNNGLHPFKCKNSNVTLNAGNYTLQLDYFQGPKVELGLQLLWTVPGSTTEVITPITAYVCT